MQKSLVLILAHVDKMQNLLVLILSIHRHTVATGLKRLCKLNFIFCVCVCVYVCVNVCVFVYPATSISINRENSYKPTCTLWPKLPWNPLLTNATGSIADITPSLLSHKTALANARRRTLNLQKIIWLLRRSILKLAFLLKPNDPGGKTLNAVIWTHVITSASNLYYPGTVPYCKHLL